MSRHCPAEMRVCSSSPPEQSFGFLDPAPVCGVFSSDPPHDPRNAGARSIIDIGSAVHTPISNAHHLFPETSDPNVARTLGLSSIEPVPPHFFISRVLSKGVKRRA